MQAQVDIVLTWQCGDSFKMSCSFQGPLLAFYKSFFKKSMKQKNS